MELRGIEMKKSYAKTPDIFDSEKGLTGHFKTAGRPQFGNHCSRSIISICCRATGREF